MSATPRGFSAHDEQEGPGTLEPWEALVVDAVGNLIDFWQFKRNQGRVWALLYLRGTPFSAGELQEALGLSKGAVSMLTRDLETWGVIHRVRSPADSNWRFVAETDLMRMVGRVISQREATVVRRVLADIDHAEMLASRSKVDRDELARLRKMRTLAKMVDTALQTFLATARLDVGAAVTVLAEALPKLRGTKRR